jgi:hypothetical protein
MDINRILELIEKYTQLRISSETTQFEDESLIKAAEARLVLIDIKAAITEATKSEKENAEPEGEVVVTKDLMGAIVAVTRQNAEGQVLSVIARSGVHTNEDDSLTIPQFLRRGND